MKKFTCSPAFLWPFVICYFPIYAVVPSVGAAHKIYLIFMVLFGFFLLIFSRERIVVHRVFLIFILPTVVPLIIASFHYEALSYARVFVFFKYIIFFLIAMITANLIKVFGEGSFSRGVKACFVVQIAVCILQVMLPSNPLEGVLYYKAADSFLGLRPGGTFEWVYSTSFFYLFFIVYGLDDFLSRHNVSGAAMAMLGILMTIFGQSKVGYLAVVLGLFVYVFALFVVRSPYRYRAIYIGLLFAVLLAIFVSSVGFEFEHLKRFLDYIFAEGGDASTNTRFAQISRGLADFGETWHVGGGDSFEYVIENSYVDALNKYGIWGVFYLVTFYFFWIAVSFLVFSSKFSSRSSASSLRIAAFITISSVVVYALAGSITETFRSAAWFYLLVGYVVYSLSCSNRRINILWMSRDDKR